MSKRLRSAALALKRELSVYRAVAQHPKTPRLAKWCLGLAISYTLLPIDLIPDFIPVIGQFDDAVIVPVLVILAIRMIPPEVVSKCRQNLPAE